MMYINREDFNLMYIYMLKNWYKTLTRLSLILLSWTSYLIRNTSFIFSVAYARFIKNLK